MTPLLTLDAIFLFDVLCTLDSFLIAVVPDGYIGAGFCKGLSDGKSNPSSGTGYDSSLPLVREEW